MGGLDCDMGLRHRRLAHPRERLHFWSMAPPADPTLAPYPTTRHSLVAAAGATDATQRRAAVESSQPRKMNSSTPDWKAKHANRIAIQANYLGEEKAGRTSPPV